MSQSARFASIIFTARELFFRCHILFAPLTIKREYPLTFRGMSHNRRIVDTRASRDLADVGAAARAIPTHLRRTKQFKENCNLWLQFSLVGCSISLPLLGGLSMLRVTAEKIAASRRTLTAGAAALALACLSPRFALAAALTSEQFRDEAIEILRRARPQWRVEAPPDDPTTLLVDNERLYLANLYARYGAAAPSEREAGILRFVDAMRAALREGQAPTFAAARSRLRARLVSAELVAQSGQDGRMLATRPFSPKARIAYVADSPLTMAYVSKNTLEKWSVDEEAVHAAAIENLDAISRDVAIEPHAAHSGSGLVVFIQDKDGYAAARLLAPKFMARMGETLGPEHYVGAPARDLLIAWSVDFSDKPAIAALVAKYAAGAYAVTNELFVWSADGVRPMNAAELAEHGAG